MDPDFDPLVPRPLDRPKPVFEPSDPGSAEGRRDPGSAEGRTRTVSPRDILDGAKIFAAPDDPADWPAWRDALTTWRDEARVGFDDSLYEREDLRWVRTCVTIAQVWLYDELLYDFDEHRFTPDRLLADAERFGGFDGIVLWHAYPIIGIDDRNQWDYYRQVPGLRGLVDALHERGVKVFVDYNPWDEGTRRGLSDAEELASIVRDFDIDGVFLDTLKEGDPTLLHLVEQARTGVAFEGESTLPLARLQDHAASWAQWFADSLVPGVIRSRWFEPRHQLHHVRRWSRDHGEELRSAWLNGVGVMCWEVVFGVWVGWNDRDAATLRVMSRAQRELSDLFTEGTWTPLADLGPVSAGVYGSLYEKAGQRALCLVNTGSQDALVRLDSPGFCLRGGNVLRSAVAVPAYGIGGAWWPDGAPTAWLAEDIPAVSDTRFPHRRATRLTPSVGVQRAFRDPASAGVASVALEPGEHVLTVRFRQRETGMYDGAPYVEEWKPLPPRLHDQRTLERVATIGHTFVASEPVTRQEWAAYQAWAATGTQLVPHDWRVKGADVERPDEPATGVDLGEARAFAAWLGGRLPSEDEWQLALEDPYASRGTRPVWEWTESEFSDGRTRFCMLKGGSEGQPEGSSWYFDSGVKDPDFAAKYLIPGFGLGRSESIGFRVAWDEEERREAGR